MIIGYLRVKPSERARPDGADLGVEGWYEVHGTERTIQAALGDRLLDLFADNVPLSTPEAFEVTPMDAGGNPLEYGLTLEEVAEGHCPEDWYILRTAPVSL